VNIFPSSITISISLLISLPIRFVFKNRSFVFKVKDRHARTHDNQDDVISRLLPIKEESGLVKNTDALLVARTEDGGVDEYAEKTKHS